MVSIASLDPASVIQALYAASRPQGLGFLHFTPGGLPRERAESLVGKYIDYLEGRVMKVLIGPGDEFDEWLYDRDNGAGAAAAVVAALRDGSAEQVAERIQREGIREAAAIAKADMGQPETVEQKGGMVVHRLHLPNDPRLAEAIDRADSDGSLSDL